MSAPVTIFQYEGRPVRSVQLDGQTWWVAADVCRELGVDNPRQAVRKLDRGDVQVVSLNTVAVVLNDGILSPQAHFSPSHGAGTGASVLNDGIPVSPGNPNVNVVNEPGLYTLILRSRKPQAVAFRRWVTHEVLPSIRQTGGYQQPGYDLTGVLRSLSGSLEMIALTQRDIVSRLCALESRSAPPPVEAPAPLDDVGLVWMARHYLDWLLGGVHGNWVGTAQELWEKPVGRSSDHPIVQQAGLHWPNATALGWALAVMARRKEGVTLASYKQSGSDVWVVRLPVWG